MIFCIYGLYLLMMAYGAFMSISIIMSWIPPLYDTKVFRFFRKGTDFYLRPFRGLLVLGFLDFTPIIGLAIYSFGLNCIAKLLHAIITLY